MVCANHLWPALGARRAADQPALPCRRADADGDLRARGQRALRPLRLPADVLVYSQAEVERRRDWCSSAVYWAMREGKVLYEAV